MSDRYVPSPQRTAHEAAQRRCTHPGGRFLEFQRADVEQSIPERFGQQVAIHGDRLAVKGWREGLTYEELNRKADQIAHAILAQRGAGEERIALLMDNDTPVFAAILGVLKAGKTYVPLDPAVPLRRIAYILEDSQAGLLIVDTRNLAAATELVRNRLPLLNIEEIDFTLPDENPGLSIPPDAPAWIIYTSGSTGQPKGVVQTHRNVLHYIMLDTNAYHISVADRLSQLFSCSVNFAARETFDALLNGASIHPLDLRETGLQYLTGWLVEREITIYTSVPTVFRHFCAVLTGAEEFPSIRVVKLGGEPPYRTDVDLYKKRFSSECIFINRLGSTETAPIRWYFIDKSTEIPDSVVPVGYPVQDNEILLLDEAGREVGFDQPGEIAVKSRCLAAGYWRKPDATRAAFRPVPHSDGETIYLTGDLGLMRPDGCLVHLGRKDFQVKVRGFRVEVAEIEMALAGIDTVKAAVVTARESSSGDHALVAYLIPASERPTVSELRRELAKTLPSYMIPSSFVVMESFPVAPNGKLERRALPAPGSSRPELDTPFVAPRTPIEEILSGIWREVLGIDGVGVHDNWLELGGDSLRAMQVMSRVERSLGVTVPLLRLFEADTVAELAVVVAAAREDVSPGPGE